MFRFPSVNASLRRLFHRRTVNQDQVLKQLRACSVEDQVFDVVGKNKAKLTVSHISQAVGMLWHFQKQKPEIHRSDKFIKSHPQFLTLRVLAENKIALMDDFMLINILYNFQRLNVDFHDTLIQHLVSEAWLRIERFHMASLSKFAVCLNDQQLQQSPLMGQITSILDQKLSSIDDARILTTLMISVWPLVSPRLRDDLISRAYHLLDTMDPSNYNNPRRVVQFLRNIKYNHRPLLEKCNKIFLHNIHVMDAANINIILGLYQGLQFSNCDLQLAVKRRLIELMDSSTDPNSFAKLFVTLVPMASREIREGLENTAILLVDEFSAQQALAVAEALEEIQSRNFSLLNKIASVIQRNLHAYKPAEVVRITQSFLLLQYQNSEFFIKLRNILVHFLQCSVLPSEMTMLIRILSMLPSLPSPQVDEGVISRLDAVATQCDLKDLSIISFAITKWVRNDPSYCHSKFIRLMQNLKRCSEKRLQTADRLDLLLEDLKHVSREWFEEMLLEETIVTLQRMMDQINWTNVPELALFLIKYNHLCPPLMERIASVTIENIHKIHHSALYTILLPFSVLNYDPVQADEFYDVCIQRITPHIRSFDPHLLVLLAYSLALADNFPEELIREIFSVNFLGKLDAQLEITSNTLNMRTRMRLMELNRAVCLECPEFQVPWFHESYCQHMLNKGNGAGSFAGQQMHKMLGEVLGNINCVGAAVVTPYFYTLDFECILDKHMRPLHYSQPSTLQISDTGTVQWTSSSENIRDELPPGAQRVAVYFLNSKFFCKGSHHLKGDALMKKRHLEILGYRVVQIPHFVWNSMELSTQDAWKEYLKKEIFKEPSS